MTKKAKQFYVYALIDPRTAAPFYIGKGSGTRKVQHFQRLPKWMEGEETSRKHKMIQEIRKEGFKPSAVVLTTFEDEKAALRYEASMIKRLGIALANERAGGGGDTVKAKPYKKPRPVSKETLPLTEKQERFARCLVEGMTKSDAYRIAYDVSNMTPKSVNEVACVLAADVKISSRVAELQAPALKKLQITQEYIMEGFQKAADLGEETGNAGAVTGAYREMGKLGDLYPAERKELNITADEVTERIQTGRERARLATVSTE